MISDPKMENAGCFTRRQAYLGTKTGAIIPGSDILVVCEDRNLGELGVNGAPDFVLEIASPSTRKRDYEIMLFKCRTAGVREYWVVDAETKRLRFPALKMKRKVTGIPLMQIFVSVFWMG